MDIKNMHQVNREKCVSQSCQLWWKLQIPYTLRYLCRSKYYAQGKEHIYQIFHGQHDMTKSFRIWIMLKCKNMVHIFLNLENFKWLKGSTKGTQYKQTNKITDKMNHSKQRSLVWD